MPGGLGVSLWHNSPGVVHSAEPRLTLEALMGWGTTSMPGPPDVVGNDGKWAGWLEGGEAELADSGLWPVATWL